MSHTLKRLLHRNQTECELHLIGPLETILSHSISVTRHTRTGKQWLGKAGLKPRPNGETALFSPQNNPPCSHEVPQSSHVSHSSGHSSAKQDIGGESGKGDDKDAAGGDGGGSDGAARSGGEEAAEPQWRKGEWSEVRKKVTGT